MVRMKTTYELTIRAFPVKAEDMRTGEISTDTIVLDKQRLQAAQLVGESSKELIHRIYNRAGKRVLEIGKADKLTLELYLDKIYEVLANEDSGTLQSG